MTAYLLRHVLVSNALVSEFCGALLKRPVNALTNRLHCWKRRATESRWSYFPVDTLVNPESLQTPLLTVPKHLKARTKSIKVTMWRQVCVCPVVEPVASQLSCCAAEASALVDPLSESTLLAVGATRLVACQSSHSFSGLLGWQHHCHMPCNNSALLYCWLFHHLNLR